MMRMDAIERFICSSVPTPDSTWSIRTTSNRLPTGCSNHIPTASNPAILRFQLGVFQPISKDMAAAGAANPDIRPKAPILQNARKASEGGSESPAIQLPIRTSIVALPRAGIGSCLKAAPWSDGAMVRQIAHDPAPHQWELAVGVSVSSRLAADSCGLLSRDVGIRRAIKGLEDLINCQHEHARTPA